jgi:hypothetical protein
VYVLGDILLPLKNLYMDFTTYGKCRGSLQIDGLTVTQDTSRSGFELVSAENNPGLGLLKPTKDSTDITKWEQALTEAIAHVRFFCAVVSIK